MSSAAASVGVLALLSWASSASAVAPTRLTGVEPVRLHHFTPVGQADYRTTDLWRAFATGEGAGWKVRVDERTGTPHRMSGPGIAIGPDLETGVRDFIARNAELLGAASDLPLRSFAHDADYGITYIEFDALRDGIPIWRSSITARVRNGALILLGAATYPDTPTRGGHELDPTVAKARAIAGGPAPGAVHRDVAAVPLWLPIVESNALVLRAVYEVRSRTADPVGEWRTFVDADSGEVVAWYNEVKFLSGTVRGEHDIRYPGSGTATSPLAGVHVNNGSVAVATGPDGSFTIADGPDYQTHFLSDPMILTDVFGDQGLTFTAADPDPLWTDGNGSLAVIDTWVFTSQVRDTYNAVVPNLEWTFGDADITVNIDDSCNAFYNGTLNFFRAGLGCNNTGRLADVAYHEWGHGFHFESMLAGSFDGALSEGAGDVVSFTLTDDPNMAPGFFQGGGYLRTADNDNTYPVDITNQVHEDGLIFAGAMWDMRQNIGAIRGDAVAISETKRILAGLLKGGPSMTEALDEALLADDDDGDVSNGTPNECAIVNAFADHGLGELSASGGFAAGHTPRSTAAEDVELPIQVEVVGPASCAGDFGSADSVVEYRVDGGPWQTSPLTASGASVAGSIPAQPFGSFVEYFVTITGPGETLRAPQNGVRNPFSFHVGDLLEVHCDDFEASDGGWTHELVAGVDEEGADDWQHGAPGGRGGDPQMAHSGTNVWGNDLGFGNFNGQYQNEKYNRLTSPEIGLGHYEDALLTYWRWLQVEDAVYDQASVTANGQVVWTNLDGAGQDHHQDDRWAPHAVDLDNPAGSVQVAFELNTDAGLGMGGWTLDDVCVMAPATVNNRLGVTNLEVSSGGDGVIGLSWTHPPHAPLAEVRVVRKAGDCPANALDGAVVYYDDAPVLGAAVSIEDAVPTIDGYCYGVFPGDGSASLGFAVEGWNLGTGSAATAATEEQLEDAAEENGVEDLPTDDPGVTAEEFKELGGCGCSTSTPFSPMFGLLMLIPVIRRQRAAVLGA